MKKFLFLLTAAIMAMSLTAAPVDQATAFRKAQSFLTNELYAGKMMSSAALRPVLLKAEMGNAKVNQPVYYIYNTSTTFIVVAGDDRADEILMVGDRPLKDINNLPLGMQDMLGQYKDQIMFLQEHPGLQPTSVQTPNQSLNATTYGPLLTCNWDQEAPYYNQCKFGSYQCLTGCPATSASMVFYFWKYPTAATPVVPGYKSTISVSSYSTKSYTHSALPSTTFDWANMLDNYTGSYTTAQGTAVATLMHYVGQAERMGYGVSGSGVSVDSVCNIRDAFTFFGYDSSTTRFVKKTSAYSGGSTLYTDSQWAALIQEEMAAGRPIVFCAVSSNAGGHAFNVDGYNSSTNKYHINFGWSGDGNAWCSLNSFGYSSYNFNVYQQMVIGIQPPTSAPATPTLTVSPTSLSFSTTAGQSVSKTFTVTGTNLTGNVTLTKTDANGVYTISPTTISASAAASGATVTVTYKPTAAGTQTGSITIASSGATSKTVSLSGTATAAALTTYTPVMSAANSNYITSSSFRADWTDQTSSANVSSYTLQVNKQGSSTPSTEVTLLGTINGSNYTGSYTNITLSAPWGGSNVRGGNNAVYTKNSSGTGYISFTVPSGYSNATFSVQVTTVSGSYGTGNITVQSTNTSAVGHTFSKGETYTWTVTASSGDVIYIYSTDSSYSPDMSLIKVYAGNINLNASETGDANSRTITGITNKYYTVSNLTAGATYTYKVKALYTDGTSSAWSNEQNVTLQEDSPAATPTLTVTPTSLNMSAKVDGTATATFKVTGADLTGNVTLSVSGSDVFTLSTSSITAANAANGVNVTVTYKPTAYGTQTATVTVASSGATSKTVSLNGTATLDKANPVMNAATVVSSTSFTANWTHDVATSSVSSYTLYGTLTAQPGGGDEPSSTLLGSLDGSNYTGSYASITLTSPWGGSNVKAGNGAIYTKNSSSWWSSSYGNITYTVPSGYSNATFTIQITTANTSYGSGTITVKSAKTSAVKQSVSKGNTYTWTVTASAGDKITIYSTDSSYSPDMAYIAIYAGTMSLNATATGDNTDFVITDIDATSRGITLSNLVEGGTYSIYLVANYVDGTTATSNTQEVTLVSINLGNDDLNTGINSLIADDDEIESVTYVNMAGVQSKQPFDGINIVVTRYKSGAVKSSKVLY